MRIQKHLMIVVGGNGLRSWIVIHFNYKPQHCWINILHRVHSVLIKLTSVPFISSPFAEVRQRQIKFQERAIQKRIAFSGQGRKTASAVSCVEFPEQCRHELPKKWTGSYFDRFKTILMFYSVNVKHLETFSF